MSTGATNTTPGTRFRPGYGILPAALFCALLLLSVPLTGSAQTPGIPSPAASGFIANRGQWATQALFSLRSGRLQAWFTARDVRLDMSDARGCRHVIRQRFAGAAPAAGAVMPQGVPLPARWQYIRRGCTAAAEGYAALTRQNVYPGVDVRYYAQDGALKYDLLLSPGADPRRIRIAYDGADSLSIAGDGGLRIGTSVGMLRESAPYCYQIVNGRKRTVPCRFVMRGAAGQVGFALGRHCRRLPLVIDPALVYSSYIGGISADSAQCVALDKDGGIYVAGNTASNDFPVSTGAFRRQKARETDLFVMRLNAGATQLYWATYIGGNGDEHASALAVSPSGTVVVSGWTTSNDFPTAFGTVSPSPLGAADGFICGLNPSGASLAFSTYLGGAGNDYITDMALDQRGNIYVTGGTASGNFPFTRGAADSTHSAGEDAFVARLNPVASAFLYSTFLGGTSDDRATGLALNARGVAFVTGWTQSGDMPVTPGAYRNVPGGGMDGFVASVDTTGGTLGMCTYLGGSGDDQPSSVALDSAGAVFVTGRTGSVDFPVTIPSPVASWFVLKLTSSGTGAVFSRYLGVNDGLGATGIHTDKAGNIYLCGGTLSATFPLTSDAFTGSPRGMADVALVQLNASGATVLHASVIGGSGPDLPIGRGAMNRLGEIYVTGVTASPDFPLGRNAADSLLTDTLTSLTRSDGFLLQFGFRRRGSIFVPPRRLMDTLRCDTLRSDTFYVHNIGDADLTVEGVFFDKIDQFFKLIEPSPIGRFTVRPGDSLRCVIQFRSTLANSDSNTLLVFSSDSLPGKRPDSVRVLAVRAAPSVSGPAASVIYPALPACRAAVHDTTVPLRNTGLASVTVNSISLPNAAASGFSIVSPTVFPITIGPGGSAPLRLRFTPPGRAGTFADTVLVQLAQCAAQARLPVSARLDSVGMAVRDTVQFGVLPYCVGSADTVIAIRNTGSAPLSVDGVLAPGPFSVRENVPVIIQPDSVHNLRIRFTPVPGTVSRAVLSLVTLPCTIRREVALTGAGGAANALLAGTAQIDFGTVPGCASDTIAFDTTIALRSVPGAGIITLETPVTSPPFSVKAPAGFPLNVDTAAGVQLTIRYRPLQRGSNSGVLLLPYTSGPCRDTLRLSLKGSREDLSLSAGLDSVDLGSLPQCQGVRDTVVRLYNRSGVAVTVDSVRQAGPARHWRPLLPLVIAAHDSLDVILRLAPQSAGVAVGRVVYVTQPCRDSLGFTLRGVKQGIALSLNPDMLGLPAQIRCGGAVALDTFVVVRNLGSPSSAATVAAVFINGDPVFSLDGSLTGSVLKGGDSLRLPVRLRAAADGAYRAVAGVVLDPCGDTLLLPVNCVVASPTLAMSGGNFGSIPVNSTAGGVVVLRNTTPAPVRVDSLAGLSAPFVLKSSSPAFPVLLAPGDSIQITLDFTPTVVGDYTGTPQASISVPCVTAQVVPLSGRATGATLQDSARLCIDGVYAGLTGDTVEIPVRCADPHTLAAVTDMEYVILYNSRRLQLVEVISAYPVDILQSQTGADTLRLRQRGVSATAFVQMRLRFRVLGGAGSGVGLRLDSVYPGAQFAVWVCPDSALLRLSDKCIVTGVTLGKFPNRLDPVRPNPSRQSIQITYQQLEDARAVLQVWDAAGREALRPLDQQMPGGRYTLRVDISALPAGLYYYGVQAGEWRQVRILIVE